MSRLEAHQQKLLTELSTESVEKIEAAKFVGIFSSLKGLFQCAENEFEQSLLNSINWREKKVAAAANFVNHSADPIYKSLANESLIGQASDAVA